MASPAAARLTFWHRFQTEGGFDGGVLEFSRDGTTWTGTAPIFVSGGYNASISENFHNPLRAR